MLKWCAANWPGCPRWRWSAVERAGGGAVLGDDKPGQGRSGRDTRGVISVFLCETATIACRDSTFPPRLRHDPSMDLERLGHLIVSRRVALGYRNRTDLANRLQLTVRTL